MLKLLSFCRIFVANIVQSCWKKQYFGDILKHTAFHFSKCSNHEILQTYKNKKELSKYQKKIVGFFISFVANVIQSFRN